MPLNDTHLTLATPGEATYTESRSRFLGFAMHVADENEAKAIIVNMRKTYYDARHVCFAYVLGADGKHTRQSDDGEPAGTAGAPIARRIASKELTDVLVVVVRYFGGVKLGTSRLGVAYKTAAADALDAATVCEVVATTTFQVAVPYTEADTAMRYVREGDAQITGRDYTATDTLLTINVRLKNEEALRQRLAKIFTLRFLKPHDEAEDGQ